MIRENNKWILIVKHFRWWFHLQKTLTKIAWKWRSVTGISFKLYPTKFRCRQWTKLVEIITMQSMESRKQGCWPNVDDYFKMSWMSSLVLLSSSPVTIMGAWFPTSKCRKFHLINVLGVFIWGKMQINATSSKFLPAWVKLQCRHLIVIAGTAPRKYSYPMSLPCVQLPLNMDRKAGVCTLLKHTCNELL